MVYLNPQWFGSADEMIAFGRELVENSPASNSLPLEFPRVYRMLATKSKSPDAIYSQPAVWADVQPVFEKRLRRYPDDNAARSEYAMFAWRCKQWKTAVAQFKILGDHVDPKTFGTAEMVGRAKAEVARNAGKN